MNQVLVTAVPDEYKQPVRKECRGTVTEVSYPVGNYINRARKLVTNRAIEPAEAGRETVAGDAITKTCNVYLPAGFDGHNGNTRYDVLYLLHGVGGDQWEWLRGSGETDGRSVLCNLFDNLIANGEIDPLIVVFPNGRSAEDWANRSFDPDGAHLLGFYYFDYELRHDLIPFIESVYPTFADIRDRSPEGMAYGRMHRAIAGLSMGGMQALNLTLGGYRCDSAKFTGRGDSPWKNGLDTTVLAPGMTDLFAYVGAFSNAPTTSEGRVLGSRLASAARKIDLLYMTCGDADDVSLDSYRSAINGLAEASGGFLGDFYQVLVRNGGHDFHVWLNGAYNFVRLAFRKRKPSISEITLQ
jgi:S-formylglutathione hydrolase FrmB